MSTNSEDNLARPSDLKSAIDLIKSYIEDNEFNLVLNLNWNSHVENYRQKIREHLGSIESSKFNRKQLSELYDLNKTPETAEGSISISHCQKLGGYSYSQFQHGFDIEEVHRISEAIIIRTSSEDERAKAPQLKFLWVAKEAALKAIGQKENSNIILPDIICKNWVPTNNANVWTFQIHSEKAISLEKNSGYAFALHDFLVAVFFK